MRVVTEAWFIHLAAAPGKCMELAWKASRKAGRLGTYILATSTIKHVPQCIEPLPGDNRFASEGWRRPAQAFLLYQQWWHNATHEVPEIAPHHEDVVSFGARQLLDVFSPSNVPLALLGSFLV
jgi:polyhydroxyalkanoate synthase subunit PhaC